MNKHDLCCCLSGTDKHTNIVTAVYPYSGVRSISRFLDFKIIALVRNKHQHVPENKCQAKLLQ